VTATADLMEGWRALEEATGPYEEALAYFKGTAAERFANQKIRELIDQSGMEHTFRLAAIPVKVMAKRCRIASVTADSEPVKKRLEEIRLANQAKLLEPLVIRKMFTFGDANVLVWPVEDAEADLTPEDGETTDVPAEDELATVGVEISYHSPLHSRVMYDGQDGRRPRFAIRRWLERSPLGESQDRWRAEVHYQDRVEPWRTKAGAKGGNAEEWEPYAEDEAGEPVAVTDANWPLENPWGELALKHARTDLPYGEPAHAAAYGPQDAITKAITTQVVVDIEAHGWRERWRLLDDQKLLEAGQEPVNWGDAANAPAVDPDELPTSGRQRRAGVEHTYAGTKAVGEYEAPDPGALIAPVDQWVRLMSVVTETPLYELDQTVQVSGVAKDKADGPLRAKERDAKTYLDAFWVDVYSLAVRMTGLEPGTISVTWVPPDVTMDTEWWATAQTRIQTGVPVRQVLAEANYLPDQIDEWLNRTGEEMALLQRVDTLERIATAAQSLGAAVQLGVMDQGTVQALLQRAVGEIQSSDRSGQDG
jgi:hypothetical protein